MSPRPTAVFHGTDPQLRDLMEAAARNCGCVASSVPGQLLSVCPAHRMLVEDQRALDGLLFARAIARQLRAQEFRAAPEAERWDAVTAATVGAYGDWRAERAGLFHGESPRADGSAWKAYYAGWRGCLSWLVRLAAEQGVMAMLAVLTRVRGAR